LNIAIKIFAAVKSPDLIFVAKYSEKERKVEEED
jgi:hypothetical protein